MKKIFLLVLILFITSACANETNDSEITAPHGIKPVIYFQDTLYWLSNEKPLKELPSEYHDSGFTILGSEKNEDVPPTQECYTSAMNSNDIGANIYIRDANSKDIITSKGGGLYTIYIMEK